MATTIKLKNGSGAPLAGDLVQGEPAFDLTNKRLYTEDSGGTVIEVGTNPGTDVTFADNRKAIFGAGSDLQIYHDGSNSIVQDVGTGDLRLAGNVVRVRNSADTENMISAVQDGAVTLSFDGNGKLSTTSTGIDVTGTVTSDGLTVNSGAENLVATFQSTDTEAQIALVDSTGTSTIRARNDFRFHVNGAATPALKIDSNNDISFYEDTGTTQALFWDASAESLGIGTTSPANTLHIKNTTSSGAYINYDGQSNNEFGLRIESNASGGNFESDFSNGTTALLDLYANSASTSGGDLLVARTQSATPVLLVKANGNVGIGTDSPSAGAAGGKVLHVQNSGATASVRVDRSDAATAGTLSITSGNTSNGIYSTGAKDLSISTNSTERMRIDSSGNLLVGATATPTSSAGNIVLQNGTAPTASATDGVILYAEDVSSSSELKVRDEAGNITTLSPHNFDLIPQGPSEDMAWSYYSERDGKQINVDMLKAIRVLEKLSGEQLVFEN